MALLKGGTYVDGDLYVEDALKVNRIENPTGQPFPYVTQKDTTNFTERVVVFDNDTAGIIASNLKINTEKVQGVSDKYTTNVSLHSNALKSGSCSTSDTNFILKVDSDKIKVVNKDIELDHKNGTWFFPNEQAQK